MTRTLFRGAFVVAGILAASINAYGKTGDEVAPHDRQSTINFAQSSAELSYDAIRTLSELAQDQRLSNTNRIIVHVGSDMASPPLTLLRLNQVRDLLIDLGLSSGRMKITPPSPGHRAFISIGIQGTWHIEHSQRSGSHIVEDHLTLMSPCPVLEDIEPLPGPETSPPIEHRDGKMGLGERGTDMGRHVVGTLGRMPVAPCPLGHKLGEKVLKVD